jgi:hypothetical protein
MIDFPVGRAGIMVVKPFGIANFGAGARMVRFRIVRRYLAYAYAAATLSLLLPAVGGGSGSGFAEPALLEQLDGTEIPNPVFEDVLAVAQETLAIFINMIPGL